MRIRRLFASRSTPLADLEDHPPDHRRGGHQGPGRPPGGLGRGLAGILDQAQVEAIGTTPGPAGLDRLFGSAEETPASAQVQSFVARTALGVIAEAFSAEAAVLVRRTPGDPPIVTSRLPPSWGEGGGLTFELFGQLWAMLAESNGSGAGVAVDRWRSLDLGTLEGWAGHRRSGDRDLAAAVARAEPLSSPEREALRQVVRSISSALDAVTFAPPAGVTVTSVADLRSAPSAADADNGSADHASADGQRAENGDRPNGDRPLGAIAVAQAPPVVEETVLVPGEVVTLSVDGLRHTVRAEGPTPAWAMATAALQLTSGDASVIFAGTAQVDQTDVSIVVVADGEIAPLVGVALAADGDRTGPARAAFSAVGRWGRVEE